MTVAELIDLLERLPKNAQVYFPTAEYNGAHAPVSSVNYVSHTYLGCPGNSVHFNRIP